MPKSIRVLLLEDVPTLGKTGAVVTVSEGYARNFLFPEGKAALATEGVRKQAAQQQQVSKDQAAQRIAQLQEVAQTLEGTELRLAANVKEGHEIYGKITAAQIAKELNQQAGLDIKASAVQLPQPIVTTGSQDVVIDLSPEVEATVRVTVEGTAPAERHEED